MNERLYSFFCWLLVAIALVPRRLCHCVGTALVGLLCLSISLLLSNTIASASPLIIASASPLTLSSMNKTGEWVDRLAQGTQLPPVVVDRLRQALGKRTKLPAATLKVIQATPKTWSDGCLELRKPDEICTEALVEGWRVVFSRGKQRWVYRSDQQGRIHRLEPPT